MSSKHQNMKFTVEQENISPLLFLDVKICRKISKFVTSLYRKQIFSGFFIIYESFIPKRELLHILLHRIFSICRDFKTFHFEIDHLKTILILNNSPSNFVDSCIKSFLDELYTSKLMVLIVPKRNVFVKFPYLGSTLLQTWKKLQKLFSDKLTSCNLKIIFTSPFGVESFFSFKDKLPKMLFSGLVYKYKFGGYNATYYEKTKYSPNLPTFRYFTSHWKKGNDWQKLKMILNW